MLRFESASALVRMQLVGERDEAIGPGRRDLRIRPLDRDGRRAVQVVVS